MAFLCFSCKTAFTLKVTNGHRLSLADAHKVALPNIEPAVSVFGHWRAAKTCEHVSTSRQSSGGFISASDPVHIVFTSFDKVLLKIMVTSKSSPEWFPSTSGGAV